MTWPQEIQTTIDEAGDGWEGVILIGSNFEARIHGATFREVAAQIGDSIDLLMKQRREARDFWKNDADGKRPTDGR